ncbi:uncharacterized protein LOC144594228 [Rhinoraja longicauda]
MCAPCCAVPSSSRGSRLSGTVPRTVPVVPRTVPVVPRTVPVVPRTVPVVPRTVPVVPQHCPSGTPALSQWCPSTVPVVPRTVPVVPAPRCPPPATTAGHRAGPCLDAPGSDDLFAERERHRDTERGKCPGDETRRDETRRAKPGQGAVRAVKRRPASSPFGRSARWRSRTRRDGGDASCCG